MYWIKRRIFPPAPDPTTIVAAMMVQAVRMARILIRAALAIRWLNVDVTKPGELPAD